MLDVTILIKLNYTHSLIGEAKACEDRAISSEKEAEASERLAEANEVQPID